MSCVPYALCRVLCALCRFVYAMGAIMVVLYVYSFMPTQVPAPGHHISSFPPSIRLPLYLPPCALTAGGNILPLPILPLT